ncbi:BTB/POZ domain-containing protein 19 isoform X1 [Anas platyrhynchos]|uniref:BTB/POZ domain-containing protein 19 isoform X1 n=1 Tax=Anas platyrhynchos TaxID=8839 RepID=UPI000F7C9F30|eukprot:XP_027318880.1 BTB/POZ domain-containing protein 19 isoform X1 [Anas platyrhynchos]
MLPPASFPWRWAVLWRPPPRAGQPPSVPPSFPPSLPQPPSSSACPHGPLLLGAAAGRGGRLHRGPAHPGQQPPVQRRDLRGGPGAAAGVRAPLRAGVPLPGFSGDAGGLWRGPPRQRPPPGPLRAGQRAARRLPGRHRVPLHQQRQPQQPHRTGGADLIGGVRPAGPVQALRGVHQGHAERGAGLRGAAGARVVPQAAVTYGQVDLQQHCLAFIESCTAAVVRTRGFHELSDTVLARVLRSDRLAVDELDLVQAVREWAHVSSAVLGRPVPEVAALPVRELRLPLLAPSELATLESHNQRDLLIPVESIAAAWRSHALRRGSGVPPQLCRPRRGTRPRDHHRHLDSHAK